jgi:hypothetical protein
MSSRTVAMAATMFSAFIFPPRVAGVFATEQGAAPHVGEQCTECKECQADIQKVYHMLLRKAG